MTSNGKIDIVDIMYGVNSENIKGVKVPFLVAIGVNDVRDRFDVVWAFEEKYRLLTIKPNNNDISLINYSSVVFGREYEPFNDYEVMIENE